MSDWDDSEEEKPAAPACKAPAPVKSRFADEEEESGPASDWEASSEEEEAAPAPVSNAAPPKKKGNIKAKLAEKEAAKRAAAENGGGDDLYDEDAVLDPREKARLDRERELKSDLDNAASLLGSAGSKANAQAPATLLDMNPKTKDEFEDFSQQIMELLIRKHENKPLFATFVEGHVRQLAASLRDVDVRKAASALTTLANEKQKEQRDKTSGKKKGVTKAAKPILGGAKTAARVDTSRYEEALDDFGPDDFM